ncbi:MAG: protease inhibitor Inh/omp19 family protein [Pseudomonadota bacterium]
MRNFLILSVAVVAIGITGCTRSADALRVNTQAPPQPLPSTPSGSFESTQLQPAGVQPLDPNAPQQAPSVIDQPPVPGTEPVQTASLDTTASSKPITHETMTGAWTVNSDNPDCRVFLSFTKWSGGYRAGTRRCNEPALASVSAWDVKGNQVVLVDGNGTQVASLGEVAAEQYAGSLVGGKPITFSR